ncbi:hypothetical protein N8754_01510 [Candidatus Pelagibacter sp.]|nr:hypothetical protein [Candidatus Pelagibacter sp.]
MKFLKRFSYLLKYYISDKRIKLYKKFLIHGLNNGYKFCSVFDSIEELNKKTNKLICLRHDVDEISPGTLKIAKVENELGLTSTYYFRCSTIQKKVIDEIKLMGHEVSYHYETISEYIIENNIKSINEFSTKNYLIPCQELLKKKLDKFRRKYNVECKTICSHGARENSIFKKSNATLFDDIKNLKDILEIDLECYDKNYLSHWNAYVSDCPVEYNSGFRYGEDPYFLINKKNRFIFLSHPNHWSFSFGKRIKRIIKLLIIGEIQDKQYFAYQQYLDD